MTQSLEIKFLDDNNCDLNSAYAYAIQMHEGISIPFNAKVLLLSEKSIKISKLDELLKKDVSLTVGQIINEGNSFRKRSYDGILTSYKSLGRISKEKVNNKDVSCFGYEITIEPKLVLLSLNRKSASYSDTSVIKLIKKILDDHGIEYVTDDTSLLDTKFSESGLVFEQVDESDLDFLNRVCYLYGINYSFGFDNKDKNKKMCVIFSNKWTVDFHNTIKDFDIASTNKNNAFSINIEGKNCLFELNEKTEALPNIIECSVGKEKEDNSLKSIEYNGNISKHSIYDDKSESSSGDYELLNLGHLVSKTVETNIYNKQLDLIKKSHQAFINNTKDIIFSSASNLIYSSGSKLNINNLEDIDGDCREKNEFLIARTSFCFNLMFSKSFAKSEKYPESPSNLTLLFCAIPVLSQSQTNNTSSQASYDNTLGNLSKLSIIPLDDSCLNDNKCNLIFSKSQDNIHTQLGRDTVSKIYTAVVCNDKGEVSSEGGISIPSFAETAFPNMFFAKIQNSKNVIVVQYVSRTSCNDPLGSFPKIGQRVLVLQSDSVFYFNGYISEQYDYPTFNREMRNELLDSSNFVAFSETEVKEEEKDKNKTTTVKNISKKSKDRDLNVYGIGLKHFSKDQVLVMHHVLQGTLNQLVKGIINSQKEIDRVEMDDSFKKRECAIQGVKVTFDKASDLFNSKIILAREEIKTAYDKLMSDYDKNSNDSSLEKTKQEYSSAKSKLNSLYEDLSKFANEIISFLTVEKEKIYNWSLTQAIINSNGDTSLFAKNNIGLYGEKNIKLMSEGPINISSQKNISFTAKDKISFNVGNTVVEITPDAFATEVQRFSNKMNPWNSSLKVDCLSGVSIEGEHVSLKGLFSAGLSDGFGGSIETSVSSVNVEGSRFKMKTLEKIDVIFGITDGLAKVSKAIASFPSIKNPKNKKTYVGLNNFAPDLHDAIKTICKTGYKVNKAMATDGYKATIALISGLLKITEILASLVVAGMTTYRSSKEKGEAWKKDWEERTEANNFVSKKDRYVMSMCCLKNANAIAGIMPIVIDCFRNKASIYEISPLNIKSESLKIGIKCTTKEEQVGPVNGSQLPSVGSSQQAEPQDQSNVQDDSNRQDSDG